MKYAMCCDITYGNGITQTIFCHFISAENELDLKQAAEIHKASSTLRSCRNYSFYEIGKEPVLRYDPE